MVFTLSSSVIHRQLHLFSTSKRSMDTPVDRHLPTQTLTHAHTSTRTYEHTHTYTPNTRMHIFHEHTHLYVNKRRKIK